MSEETTFQRKLREKREAEEATAAAIPPTPEARPQDTDLVPDEDSGYERSEEELTIDRIIDRIDILEAYRRWIPKPVPPFRSGKKEGIHVSCPMPNHPDKHPSAWVNTEKKIWYCSGCDIGGDVIDLAAIYFGMGDYKSGKNFGEIRQRIATDYGYTFVPVPGQEPIIVAPAPSQATEAPAEALDAADSTGTTEQTAPAVPIPPPVAAPASVEAPATTDAGPALASVSSLILPEDDEDDDYDLPGLDWHEIVTPNTFLDIYMRQTCEDDVPEEYHLWLGLMALGMACGRDVVLQDRRPVLGNLNVCILGKTGVGKSRATEHVNRITQLAIPWSASDPMSRGVKQIGTPSSGENMIHQFSQPIYDPSNPKVLLGYQPIRGIVDYNELSGLVGRGNRQGSTVKSTLMQFYDGSKTITSNSMTNGALRAEDPFASVLTTAQPRALRDLITQSDLDSGFLNRWIFVTGKMKQREAFGGTEIDLTPAMNPLARIHEWADGGRKIMWSNPAAKAAYLRFFELRLNPDELSGNPLLARVNLMCKKLVLLLSANEMLDEVSEEIVHKVEKVYDYLLAVFGISSNAIAVSDTKEIEDKILKIIADWAKKNPTSVGCPLRHINKYFLGKRFERSQVEKAIKILTSLGQITPYQPPAGKTGRPPGLQYKVASDD